MSPRPPGVGPASQPHDAAVPEGSTEPGALGWRWSCKVCGHVQGEVRWGRNFCPACRCPFTIRRDSAGGLGFTGVSAVPHDWLEPARAGECANHDERTPAGACERCGDFLCAECSHFVEGRRYCAGCVSRIWDDRTARRKRRTLLVLAAVAGAYLLYFLGAVVMSLAVGMGD